MTKQAFKFNPNHVFEDNVQFVLAKKQKCYIVVTNNYKDYRFLPGIAVLRPEKIRKIPQ